eukprot:g27823.t1
MGESPVLRIVPQSRTSISHPDAKERWVQPIPKKLEAARSLREAMRSRDALLLEARINEIGELYSDHLPALTEARQMLATLILGEDIDKENQQPQRAGQRPALPARPSKGPSRPPPKAPHDPTKGPSRLPPPAPHDLCSPSPPNKLPQPHQQRLLGVLGSPPLSPLPTLPVSVAGSPELDRSSVFSPTATARAPSPLPTIPDSPLPARAALSPPSSPPPLPPPDTPAPPPPRACLPAESPLPPPAPPALSHSPSHSPFSSSSCSASCSSSATRPPQAAREWGVKVLRVLGLNKKRALFATLELVREEDAMDRRDTPYRPCKLSQQPPLRTEVCDQDLAFSQVATYPLRSMEWGDTDLLRVCLWETRLLGFAFVGQAQIERPTAPFLERTALLCRWDAVPTNASLQIEVLDQVHKRKEEQAAAKEYNLARKKERQALQEKRKEEDARVKAYREEKVLGKGTYGKVTQVVHERSQRRFALKRMAKRGLQTAELEAIRHEMKVLEKLSHDNICALHEWWETSMEVVAVLELCTGGEVVHRVRRLKHCWSEQAVASVARELAQALEYLHRCSLVHRDVKPQNLVCRDESANGGIVLIDFGLCEEHRGDGLGMTTLCGTPAYLAPELVHHAPGKDFPNYGRQVDVWALGVLVYTLVAGRFPFWDDNETKRLRLLKACKPNLKSGHLKRLSPAFKDLLAKIFVRDPKKRLPVEQVLAHPWLNGGASKEPLPEDITDNIIALLEM